MKTPDEKRTPFDPDFSPQHEQNRRAAKEHDLTYDKQSKVYRDSDGCMIRDKFGQRL